MSVKPLIERQWHKSVQQATEIGLRFNVLA